MPVAEALRWCPNLTVLPPNYPLYHELSHKLKLLLEKEIPSIEQFSIDEFFGDATGWIKDEDIVAFATAVVQVNITLSNFEENKVATMDLLNYEEDMKQSKLTASMQKLKDKFGIDIIKSDGEL